MKLKVDNRRQNLLWKIKPVLILAHSGLSKHILLIKDCKKKKIKTPA